MSEELIERLRRKKKQHRVRHLFGGAIGVPDEGETREALVNPDGPEAADTIASLQARVKELEQVREYYVGLLAAADETINFLQTRVAALTTPLVQIGE